jgi:chemotaxis protein histidine kinase CheA/ActR/RegA family two-component response regulator
MNVDDLVSLVREEYALGLTDAHETLAQASVTPEDASALLVSVEEFIDRTAQAVEMVGMLGLVSYLARLRDGLTQATLAQDARLLHWVAAGLTHTDTYLSAPSEAAVITTLLSHAAEISLDGTAQDSPTATEKLALDELRLALLQAPILDTSAEDDERSAPIEDDDLVLRRDDVDEGLLAVMLADAPTQLERLHDCLVAVTRGKATTPMLAESQRIAHTFKGSGSIIGLPAVTRLSHRLEDLLDWFVAKNQAGETQSAPAVRDALFTVDVLQQCVSHLNGEDEAPPHIREVLERLGEWTRAIEDDSAKTLELEPLAFAGANYMPAVFASTGVDAGTSATPSTQAAAIASTATAASPAAPTEEIYLRVGAGHLGRIFRRATQSIIAAQRAEQSLRGIESRLAAAQARNQVLVSRLRDLQTTVEKQAVELDDKRVSTGQFDPLEMDRYDSLHILSRFVAEAVQDQAEMVDEAHGLSDGALTALRDEQRALRTQHRDLLATRLVPAKSILPRLRRNVAQTASEMGKRVQLVIEGENVAIDSDVLSRLTEPLLHLLRNAVDHGVETPFERELAGKSPEATVHLRFQLDDQYVRVECSDDGRGLNYGAIHQRAVDLGLITRDAEPDEKTLAQLILQRGFSTKEEVSEISGRGVGMDIVNDRITSMKGTLTIASTVSVGTTFSLRVPVSGGIVLALIVKSGGQRVAIPADQIISAIPGALVDRHAMTANVGDRTYALKSLAAWLGFELNATSGDNANATMQAVLVRGATGEVALAIDEMFEVRELVVQDVGPLIRRISGMTMAALDTNGQALFLLDVAALERRAQTSVAQSASLALRARLATTRKRLLVVDDAISARKALQQLLEDRGYEVIGAVDGGDAIEKLRQSTVSLVLSDLEMPNVNGLELTRRMREVPQWANIPVIMVTSRTGEKYRDSAVAAGVNEYRVKPFADADVLETVKRLLAET